MIPVIRRMRLEDAEEAHAIDVQSFSLPWPERALRYEAGQNPHARPWVAEVDGRVAGMLVVWLIVDEAHIATLAVHPAYRRLGLAKRLLEHALREAFQEGARSALLEVRAGNQAAQAMYLGFGFEVVGRRVGYYKDNGEDAILMTLPELEGMIEKP